jgi:hypothetical protein
MFHHATSLAEQLIEHEAEPLIRQVVNLAKKGWSPRTTRGQFKKGTSGNRALRCPSAVGASKNHWIISSDPESDRLPDF